MEYKIGTWKLEVSGDFDTEEEAIKILADSYMSRSKCDWPGTHLVELLMGKPSPTRTRESIAKRVYLYVKEENKYGHKEWVFKDALNIHPFKKSHWRDAPEDVIFRRTKFRYEIMKEEEVN